MPKISKTAWDALSPEAQKILREQGYVVEDDASYAASAKAEKSEAPATGARGPSAPPPGPSQTPGENRGDIKIDRKIQALEAKKATGKLSPAEEKELADLKAQYRKNTGRDYDSDAPAGDTPLPPSSSSNKKEMIRGIMNDWLERD